MKKLFLAGGLLALLAAGCNVQPANIIPAPAPATSSSSVNANSSVTTQSTENSNKPSTLINSGKIRIYTSYKLGVSFKLGEPDVSVKEVDNKIYVYFSTMKPEEGQRVEIWSKPAGQSLVQAVTTNFLASSPAKCVAVMEDHSARNMGSYQTASITTKELLSKGDSYGVEEMFDSIQGCPPNYSVTNGSRYFAMDPAHPTKFMFFSIGQYPIAGDKADNTWQDTFTIQ